MGNRGNLNTAHFASFIRRNGEFPLRYLRRVGPCPNVHNRAFGLYATDPTCPLCGGVGEVFQEVDFAADGGGCCKGGAGGKLALVNAVLSKQRQPIEMVTGELQCTYMPGEYDMAEGDRLYLRSRDDWASQLLSVTNTGGIDYLRYFPLLQAGPVYSQDGLVDPALYQVSADGRGIKWSPAGPTQGTQVTIRYQFRPVWVVVPNSHVKRIEADNGDRFPNRCLLRMWQGLALDVQESEL